MEIGDSTPEKLLTQVNELRASLSGLESQRSILGDSVLAPAIKLLQDKNTVLESLIDFHSPEPNPVEERPIITILFTDIESSSAIASQLDPEEWFSLIDEIQRLCGDLIKKHGGEVIQYLGDGLLALFGVLEMSEQDAENAVRAGLEIQTCISNLKWAPEIQKIISSQTPSGKIHLRISIHTDRVAIGRLGTYTRRELTATGEAMNLAGKLQKFALPGSVLITDKTYHHVRARFECARQPPLKIDGISGPVQSYLVLRPLPWLNPANSRGVPGVRLPTIGREAELEHIQTYIQECISSRQVTWLQMIGQPGIGKSRLLEDTIQILSENVAPILILRTGAIQGDERQPFALIRRLWMDAFQINAEMPRQEAETRWMEQFSILSGSDDEEAAQVLGIMVGLQFLGSSLIGTLRKDPTQFRGRAEVVGRELFSHLISHQHVILLIEDLQWMDASSWGFLSQVLFDDTRHDNGLFILSTTRPEWNPPYGLMRFLGYHQFTLAPLSNHHSHQLVGGLLSEVQGLPANLVEKIVTRVEGVPYFAEEIVNWLIDQGLIRQEQNRWVYSAGPINTLPIPDTLNQLLSTRLSHLKEAERLALQRGSIFGRNFWEGGLEALGSEAVHVVLEKLQNISLVYSEIDSILDGQQEWRFYHDLLQQAAYESILKRQRRELHRLAEKWLEMQLQKVGRLEEFAGQLAIHAEQAGLTDVASVWYERAGSNAFQRSALLEARVFYDHALELCPQADREKRWNILLARQETFQRLGETQAWQADITALADLARLSGEDTWFSKACYLQGFCYGLVGDLNAELLAYNQGLEAARKAQNPKAECENMMVKVTCLSRMGRMEEAEQTAVGVLPLARSRANEELLTRVLINISVYYIASGRLDLAERLMSEQVEITRQMHDRWGHSIGLINLGYIYFQLATCRRGLMGNVVY